MNPFSLKYNSQYFCDREDEINQLTNNLNNGLNTLVHSPRRLGKTALIQHLFHIQENGKTFDTIFVDLYASQNMQHFTRILAEKILQKYHSKNFITGIGKMLKGLKPSLSFTPDGYPQLSLNLTENEVELTLNQLFRYLDNRNKKVVIALDEFQEVSNYPEKAEAILRTHIQQLQNVWFIFSGSSNHILQEMFFSSKRPFYQSTEILSLGKINDEKYKDFIRQAFQQNWKSIDEDALTFVMEFSEGYTFYTHALCNHLFFQTDKKLTYTYAYEQVYSYLDNRKTDFTNLLSLLPENQRKFIIAVAKEGIVSQPTALEFIIKHKLPSVSSTLQAMNALNSKEILYKNIDGYVVYDVFFRRFLEKYY
jgi:hypothetical protein